jgi:ADP-heptose:LPS heptosyltransferase
MNVMIYRLGSLGDTVIALPCFHKIRERFPDADITLLTNKPVMTKAAAIEAVLGRKYFFNKVLAYPVGTRNLKLLFALIMQIRAAKIHTLINITAPRTRLSSLRDKLFFRLAGVKNFIGFPGDGDYETAIDEQTCMREWEAKRLARRLKELGTIPLNKESYWDLKLEKEEIEKADNALTSLSSYKPLLAVSVGTKFQSKDWGLNNWISLMKSLSVIYPEWQLVILGAVEEEPAAQQCLTAWGNAGISLCGKVSPRVSAAVLKHAALFIGHDSGPMHLAACVGTPCVAIFSAQNLPGQWYPRGQQHSVIYRQVDCAGCGLEVCIEQKKKCILSISVEEVVAEVESIVEREGSQDVQAGQAGASVSVFESNK